MIGFSGVVSAITGCSSDYAKKLIERKMSSLKIKSVIVAFPR